MIDCVAAVRRRRIYGPYLVSLCGVCQMKLNENTEREFMRRLFGAPHLETNKSSVCVCGR